MTSWIFSAFINPANPGDPVWLRVYWLLGALAFAAALMWSFVPFDEARIAVDFERSRWGRDVRQMMQLCWQPLVAIFLVCAFVYVLIEQAVQTWLPTFNNEVVGLSAALSVQLASVYSASLAAGRLGAGVLLRILRWPTLLTSCLVGAGALLILSLQGGQATALGVSSWSAIPPRALLLPLIGLFLAPVYPTICSAMLSALPIRQHAPMTGLIIVFSALGGTVGSFITGRVFSATDGRTAFSMAIVPIVLLLVLLRLFDLRLRTRLAADPGATPA
jgi:FHS family glucose/mannose:H+ symporter-like MFS transporter